MTDARKLDKRVIDRSVDKGLITRKELDDHLKALPDVADKAENVEASLADRDEGPQPQAKAKPKKAAQPKKAAKATKKTAAKKKSK